jgi:hypothetical protein
MCVWAKFSLHGSTTDARACALPGLAALDCVIALEDRVLRGAIGSEFSKLHVGTSHGIKIGAITTNLVQNVG